MQLPEVIVDSHVHLWNPAQFRYPWLDSLPSLNRAFLTADFAAASAKASVDKMIFVECGCEPSQSLAEVDWISALATQEPRLTGVIASAPLERGEGARAALAALAQRPLVKGVRRVLQAENDLQFCLRPDFIAGVELLEQWKFTFDLCARHEQLPAVEELARRVPQVQFVLDHLGKPPVREGKMQPWATDLRSLAKVPNVSCKISGLTTEADWKRWRPEDLKSYFEIALDSFGVDRVLFGGDWPVCTLATHYQTWVYTVAELAGSFDDEKRAKLFGKNAERIYSV